MIDIENGCLLLIDKPYTWTSFQTVKKIRYYIRNKYSIKKIKVGHAGTLDPLATGLLLVCVGKYTKKIEEYQSQEKEYEGVFTLGATTPSYDLEKPIDKTYPIDHIEEEDILRVAKGFIGEQEQIPPIFSAVRVGGKRAYNIAREDKKVELKPRTISIDEFEITRVELPEVGFRIVCSKGTYIRSIARDFGKALGSGAYLSELIRTRIGEFKLEDAYSIDEFETRTDN